MTVCDSCLHNSVCSYKRIYDKKSIITCKNFLGWVKVIDERPEVYRNVFIIDPAGLPFVGYYNNFEIEKLLQTSTLYKQLVSARLTG